MNWKRRALLKALSAVSLVPQAAAGNTDRLPRCTESLTLAPGVQAFSTLSTTQGSTNDTRSVRTEYGILTLYLTYRTQRSDGADPGRRSLIISLRQPPGGGATKIAVWSSAMQCPTNVCGADDDMQLRLMVDKQAFARLRLKAGEARQTGARHRMLILTDDQERELRQGRVLWLEVATRSAWERGELSIRGMDDWLKEAERFHRNRVRSTLASGATCKSASDASVSPCYVTTLIGYHLGRTSSAFEQRQMNKLQPRFAAYPEHIEAYVQDAMLIGDRLNERHMRGALLLFYVLFIWPSSLLIAVRALWPGALWYFTGFLALKGLHTLTRRNVPAAPSG